MIYKYWIEFDDEGNIKAFYKNKEECKEECREFIVKLIPIDRLSKAVDGFHNELQDFSKGVKDLVRVSKKAATELDKIINKMKI